jgi:plasmid stability protein
MAQLIVRNIEEQLVQELELRAAKNARSAEEEHRQILLRALSSERRSGSSLKAMLSEMPDVGVDGDFERTQDLGRSFAL